MGRWSAVRKRPKTSPSRSSNLLRFGCIARLAAHRSLIRLWRRRSRLACAFVARLGADKVSTASQDLHAYRRDMWARELLAVAAAQPAGVLPAAVVWPSSTDELQAVVELALAHHVSLTPFGAGSGVTGGATPSAGSLVVDCKRLRSFRSTAIG